MDAKVLQVPAGFEGSVDPRVVSITEPSGPAAEQFRLLHLRLEQARAQRPIRVVAMTSAIAGEGKSVTVANLAACAARRGRRVALLDCDLRRPRVASLFGIDEGSGLASVLAGHKRLEDALRIGPERLTLLPAGAAPDDPGHLFAGDAFRAVLDRFRKTHDEIYLDLPPVLPFADATAAAGAADGVIVVVRNEETRAELVEEAVGSLSGTPLLGCVLTGCNEGAVAYRKYYGRS
jgi:protein-tyrosine kinase